MDTSAQLNDIRARRKALTAMLGKGGAESVALNPRSSESPIPAPHPPAAQGHSHHPYHSDPMPHHQASNVTAKESNILEDLQRRLRESEKAKEALEKKLVASEGAREGLEQMHIDLRDELRTLREHNQTEGSTYSAVMSSVEHEADRYKKKLDVYKSVESRLAKYAAIVSRLSKYGSQETLLDGETKPEYLYWGLRDPELHKCLQREAPYLHDYLAYLTDKVAATEKDLKSTRNALAELKDDFEKERGNRKCLEGELERCEDVLATMEVLREGTNVHIAELEARNGCNIGATKALRTIRESLVTFPGGLTALCDAIGFNMDVVEAQAFSALSFGASGGGASEDKYRYSNAFERTRRHRYNQDKRRKVPSLEALIDDGDGRRLNSIQDEDLPVIVGRIMQYNASAVTKIPVLTTQIDTLTKELDGAREERARLLKKTDSLEWRLRNFEQEKKKEEVRMRLALEDSVNQVEMQNHFSSQLELELEQLRSTVRKEDSHVNSLRQRLSDSLRESGQVPGEDMALDDLVSIANSALRLAPGTTPADKPVRTYDALGHEVIAMPGTPPLAGGRSSAEKGEHGVFPYPNAYEEEVKHAREIRHYLHDPHALDAAGQIESRLRVAFDRLQSMRE